MLKLFSSQLRKIAVSFQLLILVSLPLLSQNILKLAFEGTLSELKFDIKEFSPALPSDWSSFNYLVMEIRTSSPQRFSIWLKRTDGTPVRVMFQPFGKDIWFRASLPLIYFVGMDKSGNDLASANNRRTNSFWFSTWGLFGDIKAIESIGFAMQYRERSLHLIRGLWLQMPELHQVHGVSDRYFRNLVKMIRDFL